MFRNIDEYDKILSWKVTMTAQTVKNIKLAILVTHKIKKTEGGYVAYCPELKVTTQGKTVIEANNNLKEAVILYLETLDQLGIRDTEFKKRNIKVLNLKDKIKKTIDLDFPQNGESFITTQVIPLAC